MTTSSRRRMTRVEKGGESSRASDVARRDQRDSRTSRTHTVRPGLKITVTEWNEGLRRRREVVAEGVGPIGTKLLPHEIQELIAPTGVLVGRAYVEASIAAARASARAIFRAAGLPEGHAVWWRAKRGKRWWPASQLKFEPWRRKGWRGIHECNIPREFGRVEGSPERLAGRILETANRLERLLSQDNPDRWELVDAAFDFEMMHRSFLDLFGDAGKGRSAVEKMSAHSRQSKRPPTSVVRKYLPEMIVVLKSFKRSGQIEGWKAHLVRWLYKKGLSMTPRGMEKAIDRLVDQGELVPPFQTGQQRGRSSVPIKPRTHG